MLPLKTATDNSVDAMVATFMDPVIHVTRVVLFSVIGSTYPPPKLPLISLLPVLFTTNSPGMHIAFTPLRRDQYVKR